MMMTVLLLDFVLVQVEGSVAAFFVFYHKLLHIHKLSHKMIRTLC